MGCENLPLNLKWKWPIVACHRDIFLALFLHKSHKMTTASSRWQILMFSGITYVRKGLLYPSHIACVYLFYTFICSNIFVSTSCNLFHSCRTDNTKVWSVKDSCSDTKGREDERKAFYQEAGKFNPKGQPVGRDAEELKELWKILFKLLSCFFENICFTKPTFLIQSTLFMFKVFKVYLLRQFILVSKRFYIVYMYYISP